MLQISLSSAPKIAVVSTLAISSVLASGQLHAQETKVAPVAISVDAKLNRHPINPLIYGVAHADTAQLKSLNAPLNRSGGNSTTRYNWQQNADNRANDWFFESIADEKPGPGERADSFIERTKAAGAQAMWTIPLIDWLAKVGPNRERLGSFPVAKYGAQQKTDPYAPEFGNGVTADGKPIEGNDPGEANAPNSPEFQGEFVANLFKKWGSSNAGGLKYYLMDNEPAIWQSTHRDVQPVGITMQDLVDKTIAYSGAVKAVDPGALVVGPEEWGWTGYFYSGFDSQFGPNVKWDVGALPDRKKLGGMDAMPWYLRQMRRAETQAGHRLLDVFTLHIYPQGGEFSDDISPAMQARRNRSTRALWDENYKDETWINDTVKLIPRLKGWVAAEYPGTPIGITEYNWGAENHINGATAQADILGIFGRENLDLATRWTTPAATTPTFKAMQLFRNPNGQNLGFGDLSISDQTPNPDEISSFAAIRRADGALTVMVVNKKLLTAPNSSTPIALSLKNFAAGGAVQGFQLTAANQIKTLPTARLDAGTLSANLPDGSVTLFVVPAA